MLNNEPELKKILRLYRDEGRTKKPYRSISSRARYNFPLVTTAPERMPNKSQNPRRNNFYEEIKRLRSLQKHKSKMPSYKSGGILCKGKRLYHYNAIAIDEAKKSAA